MSDEMKDVLKQFDSLDLTTEIQVHKVYRIGKDFLVSFDASSPPANDASYDRRECFTYHLYDLDDRFFETGVFETLESAKFDVLSKIHQN